MNKQNLTLRRDMFTALDKEFDLSNNPTIDVMLKWKIIETIAPIAESQVRTAEERLLDELEERKVTMLTYPSGYPKKGISVEVIKAKRQALKEEKPTYTEADIYGHGNDDWKESE